MRRPMTYDLVTWRFGDFVNEFHQIAKSPNHTLAQQQEVRPMDDVEKFINQPPTKAEAEGGRCMSYLGFQPQRRRRSRKVTRGLQAALLSGSLLATPWLFAAEPGDQAHDGHASPVSMPGWTQTLKGQTVVEDTLEGRADRSEKIELQHHRLMRKIEEQAQKDAQA